MSLVGTAGLHLYRVDNPDHDHGRTWPNPKSRNSSVSPTRRSIESPYQRQINSAYAMVHLGIRISPILTSPYRADQHLHADSTTRTCIRRYRASFIFPNCYRPSVSKILSFGKVRASWAEVGNDTALSEALTTHFIRIRRRPYRRVRSPTRPYPTAISTDPTVRGRSAPSSTSEHAHRARLYILQPADRRDQIRHVNTSISTGYSTACSIRACSPSRHRNQAQHHSRKDKNWRGIWASTSRATQQGALAGRIADVRGWRTPNG